MSVGRPTQAPLALHFRSAPPWTATTLCALAAASPSPSPSPSLSLSLSFSPSPSPSPSTSQSRSPSRSISTHLHGMQLCDAHGQTMEAQSGALQLSERRGGGGGCAHDLEHVLPPQPLSRKHGTHKADTTGFGTRKAVTVELSRKHGTHGEVTARFWLWLSGRGHKTFQVVPSSLERSTPRSNG